MVFDLEQGDRYNDKAVAELQAELQQLKAEIALRLRDYDEYMANGQHVLARQSLQAIRQLSAV